MGKFKIPSRSTVWNFLIELPARTILYLNVLLCKWPCFNENCGIKTALLRARVIEPRSLHRVPSPLLRLSSNPPPKPRLLSLQYGLKNERFHAISVPNAPFRAKISFLFAELVYPSRYRRSSPGTLSEPAVSVGRLNIDLVLRVLFRWVRRRGR